MNGENPPYRIHRSVKPMLSSRSIHTINHSSSTESPYSVRPCRHHIFSAGFSTSSSEKPSRCQMYPLDHPAASSSASSLTSASRARASVESRRKMEYPMQSSGIVRSGMPWNSANPGANGSGDSIPSGVSRGEGVGVEMSVLVVVVVGGGRCLSWLRGVRRVLQLPARRRTTGHSQSGVVLAPQIFPSPSALSALSAPPLPPILSPICPIPPQTNPDIDPDIDRPRAT